MAEIFTLIAYAVALYAVYAVGQLLAELLSAEDDND